MDKVKALWFSMPSQACHVLMAFFVPNGLQSFVPRMHKTTIAHFAQFWEGKDEIMVGNSIKHLTFSIAIDLFMSIKEGPDFYSLQHHMKAYDALPSAELNSLEGPTMCSCGKLGLEGRSRLPALKRGRGAC